MNLSFKSDNTVTALSAPRKSIKKERPADLLNRRMSHAAATKKPTGAGSDKASGLGALFEQHKKLNGKRLETSRIEEAKSAHKNLPLWK